MLPLPRPVTRTATLALAGALGVGAAAATQPPAEAATTTRAATSGLGLDPKPARRSLTHLPRAHTTSTPAASAGGAGAFLHMTSPSFTHIAKAPFVVLQQHQHGRIAAIRAARPGVKVYVYSNMQAASSAAGSGAYQPSVIGYPQLQAHPEWALKGANGAPARWRDYSYLQPFDQGNPSLQRLAVSTLKAELNRHDWDGVMLDDVNASLDGHVWTATPANLTGGSVYRATDSFLRAVAPAIRASGKEVVVNMQTRWDSWKPQVTAWSPLVDVVNLEHCTSWGSAAPKPTSAFLPGPDTQWRLDEMAAIQARGARVWCLDEGAPTDSRAAGYGRAVFLLGWNGTSASASMYTPVPATASWFTGAGTLDLGRPTGATTKIGTWVYRRPFAKGVLYVNASTSTTTVTTRAGRVTMAPLTSIVR